MYKITSIEIAGFRGSDGTLRLPMDADVNFFIGRNGTGKTRLMNLLNFALSGDARNLMQIEFRSVLFRLSRPRDRARPFIRISRGADEDGYIDLTYELGTSSKAKPQTYRISASDINGPWMRRQYRLLSEPRYYHTDEPSDLICPLLSGPISILEMAAKEEWNGKEAQT